MKPLIGIIARVEYPGDTHKLVVHEDYRRMIIENGGVPISILPVQGVDYTNTKYNDQEELAFEEKEMITRQIDLCDGILLPGGFKINKFDRFIASYVIENDIPTFGICLGMQILANYGRELWNERNDSFIEHNVDDSIAHSVTLDKSSILYSIINEEKIDVNSRHSFHILQNDMFDVTSLSDDNYIESIEMKNKKFILGVQWHPETLKDDHSNDLFKYFIDTCK